MCLLDNTKACVNSAYVYKWQEKEITPNGRVAVTRQSQGAADADGLNGITDLVEAGSIVAADDVYYDYYLLKVTSSGAVSLEYDTTDDHSAACHRN